MIPFWKAVGRGLPSRGGPVGDAQPAFPCQVPAAWLSDKDLFCQAPCGAQVLCSPEKQAQKMPSVIFKPQRVVLAAEARPEDSVVTLFDPLQFVLTLGSGSFCS